MAQEIHQVRGIFVNVYLIEWGDDLVLIDGGFIGDVVRLKKFLKRIDKTFEDITHILLTHGHIDHTANLSLLKKFSGARVAGHPKDKDHILGRHRYRGSSRICGMLEAVGRAILSYKPFELDAELEDDQLLNLAGGIRVVHLPGHTIGHCGFFHEPTQILFTGDLYQHSWYREGLAPFFFNSCPEYFPSSIEKILRLNPKGIYSNHSDSAEPAIQFERLRKFVSGRKADAIPTAI